VIRCGVVGGSPLEDLDTDGPLLEPVAVSRQGLFHNIGKYRSIAFAILEDRAGKNPLELPSHLIPLEIRVGMEDPV